MAITGLLVAFWGSWLEVNILCLPSRDRERLSISKVCLNFESDSSLEKHFYLFNLQSTF